MPARTGQKTVKKTGKKSSQKAASYKKLFSSININQMKLDNRIVLAPAHEGLATLDGYVTPAFIDHYLRIAQGGTAMIVLGGVGINPRPFPSLRLSDDKFIPGCKELTDRIHSETNTKIVPQIYDLLKVKPGWKQKVEEVSIEQLKESIDFHEAGALRAREAGFDAIEIHAAHGYLLSCLLSLRNHRTDEYGGFVELSSPAQERVSKLAHLYDDYGGNVDARMKLLREIYERLRKALGKDYPIGIRINGDDFIVGGNTLTSTRVIAVKLAALGLDYISISAGGKLEDSPGTDPYGLPYAYPPFGGYSGFRCMPQADMPEACNVFLAEAIRQSVREAGYDTPIMTAGRINRPELAESILQDGRADLIGLCRGLVRDPDWPKKAKENRSNEINKCRYCNACLEGAVRGEGGHCKYRGPTNLGCP